MPKAALVCLPAALVILAFAWTVRRRFREVSVDSADYWIRIGAVTGILAIALQEISDFSLQMPGNAVLFVVLLALAARHSRPGRGPHFMKAGPVRSPSCFSRLSLQPPTTWRRKECGLDTLMAQLPRMLGWQHRMALRDGIADTYEWFVQQQVEPAATGRI